MSIFPLPVFEAEVDPRHRSAMSDEEVYARLEAPKTIVVRFGVMKLVGEFPYEGDAKPGCGSKLVARTIRGLELCEMLTTTCSNSGCGKSISRNEMRDYIENSGGKDYPFHHNGRILRVATIDDLNKNSALEAVRREAVAYCKTQVAELSLRMKLVEAEPILGGDMITFYYLSEDRIDFRELVGRLAAKFQTRIEMRQVAARDEARLVADYERCGQHCCCKNFLKVLKPVSMRSAKQQKATLDPLKISGRCGRLMCCLRYEDQTYRELKANLPARNKRVGTAEGPGVVVDSKILVQLVLVRLEHDLKEIAVPVEELMDPNECPKPGETQRKLEAEQMESDALRGLSPEQVKQRTDDRKRAREDGGRGGKRDARPRKDAAGKEPTAKDGRGRPERGKPPGGAGATESGVDRPVGRTKSVQQDAFRERAQAADALNPVADDGNGANVGDGSDQAAITQPGEKGPRKRRRRRGRKNRGEAPAGDGSAGGAPGSAPATGDGGAASAGHVPPTGHSHGEDQGPPAGDRKKRRRRRRRRGGGGEGGSGAGGGGQPGSGGGGDSGGE